MKSPLPLLHSASPVKNRPDCQAPGSSGVMQGSQEGSQELRPPFPLSQIPKYQGSWLSPGRSRSGAGSRTTGPACKRLISEAPPRTMDPGTQDAHLRGAKAAGESAPLQKPSEETRPAGTLPESCQQPNGLVPFSPTCEVLQEWVICTAECFPHLVVTNTTCHPRSAAPCFRQEPRIGPRHFYSKSHPLV